MFCTENGKWARRACPVGEYFNGRDACGKARCPYIPVPGDCESFVTPNGTKEKCDFGFRFDSIMKQCVPFAEASCLEVQCEGTERKNHPISCNQYLQCHDQQWEVENCGWFRNKFDMTSKECVFAWWGHKETCRYDPATCNEGSNSPVVGNCRQYVTCTDGREQEGSCFWPKKFDISSSKCVWWGAKCA
uniref:Chitin-binding type-2 domain-containing protein n=2 Tax=Lygus hesperus TaxID=30085 RepID=A0A0K8T4P6_LYGHE